MSSLATKGQEASIRVTVQTPYAGQFGLNGLLPLVNVNEWSLTPRTEIVEKDYLGEKTTSLDVQHNGYDFSFSVDETSPVFTSILALMQYLAENSLPPPVFAVAATVKYRDGVTLPRTEQLIDCRIVLKERGFASRTDYIVNSFEGKARSLKLIVG